ncbi:MAG: ABC transporter permease [Gammaproteobacteria bacterium]|nr:MAG: ABC transporter permease [Gammaproteobacteria bacterium]
MYSKVFEILPFKPEILWTDGLVFLLFLGILVFTWYTRHREHLCAPWREVAKKPLGMAALTILMFFIAVGLMDSLHFRPKLEQNGADTSERYAGEILSVLDVVLGPLRTQNEKTYSAPFATHLYAKEQIEREDGSSFRDYPPLRYGGAHLSNNQSLVTDVRNRSISGAIAAFTLWLILFGFSALVIAKIRRISWNTLLRHVLNNDDAISWRVVIITSGVIFLLIGVSFALAPYYHIFGTDKVGEDVFYQTLKSIRTGLVIGTLATLVMLPIAILLGIMAGYFRGWVDDVIQYVYTTLNSIPGVLLIAATVLMMLVYMDTHPELFQTLEERADFRLLFLSIILGVTSWTGLCRLLRAETLKLREMEYVQAAHALGEHNLIILLRHILPNVMHIVLIMIVLDFSGLVLAEAVLSYLNIGVDPTMYSWGNMINSARLEMSREPIVWWSLLAAFIFMFMLVLSANLFSDAVRDAFDPRLRVR